MIELASDELVAQIDPRRGGAIVSLVDRRTGTELLFRAPWRAGTPSSAGGSEDEWVAAWAGGWNLLFPNAGAACSLEGRTHPFHGEASLAPWRVTAAEQHRARLAWNGIDGLGVCRAVDLAGNTLHVLSRVENHGPSPVPFLAVEHLVFGEQVLGSSASVDIARAEIVPLADDGSPLSGKRYRWPVVERGVGPEDWSTRLTAPASRFGAAVGLQEPAVSVDVADRGLVIDLTWSEAFPFLWFWEERCSASAPPWDSRTTCLGLEPAMSSTGEGIAAALQRGEADVLSGGAGQTFWVRLAVGQRR